MAWKTSEFAYQLWASEFMAIGSIVHITRNKDLPLSFEYQYRVLRFTQLPHFGNETIFFGSISPLLVFQTNDFSDRLKVIADTWLLKGPSMSTASITKILQSKKNCSRYQYWPMSKDFHNSIITRIFSSTVFLNGIDRGI